MKSAKIFLAGMYLHIILSIITPIMMLVTSGRGWTSAAGGLFSFYILMILLVLLSGWVSVAMAVIAYKRGEYEKIRSGWRLLKYASIPFYILNFIYSAAVWFVLIGASRGIMLIFVPIPIGITCTMIFQSGCIGWCYIRFFNRQREESKKLSWVHYVLQVVAVLDVVSTLLIARKEAEKI